MPHWRFHKNLWVLLKELPCDYEIFFFIGQNRLAQVKQSACGAAFRSFSKPFAASFTSSGRISSVVRPWDLAVDIIEQTCLTAQGGNSLVILWFLSKNRRPQKRRA
jgi:hypothetical protein